VTREFPALIGAGSAVGLANRLPSRDGFTRGFDNTTRCDQFTGNTPDAQRAAKLLSRAIVRFARNGNPSLSGLAWPAFDSQRLATMVFDAHARLE
jgi:carboxylesterase type B